MVGTTKTITTTVHTEHPQTSGVETTQDITDVRTTKQMTSLAGTINKGTSEPGTTDVGKPDTTAAGTTNKETRDPGTTDVGHVGTTTTTGATNRGTETTQGGPSVLGQTTKTKQTVENTAMATGTTGQKVTSEIKVETGILQVTTSTSTATSTGTTGMRSTESTILSTTNLPQSTALSGNTCESGWSLFGNRCYKFSPEATDWASAKYLCECGGADLVSIASQAEDNFVASLIGSEESWIGLNDLATQETYVWTDGTTFSYNNWNTNQPSNTNNNQDCVKMKTDGKWDDVTCSKSIKYVCEKGDSSVTKKPSTCTTPAPTTSTTTVSTTQSPNCDVGWSHHQGKCYKVMTDNLSWEDARKSCSCTQSAELASITTAEEQAVAKSMITENTWIGATDVETEDTFVWSDGTTFVKSDYTSFWSSGQPNNAGDTSNQDCVSLKSDGLWDDVACSTTRQYLCEKPDKTGTALSSNTACSCATGWSGLIETGKCYKKFSTPLASFELSRAACQAESADLASVGSAAEQAFVWSILGTSSPNGWIGGEDKTTEGTFVWTDGTSFSFTNWKDGQPGGGDVQNCLQMRFTDGLWDDIKCSKTTNVYICKK